MIWLSGAAGWVQKFFLEQELFPRRVLSLIIILFPPRSLCSNSRRLHFLFSLFFSKQYILLRKVLSPIHDVKGEIILIITREGLYSTRKVVKLIEMKFKMSNKN